MMLPFKELIAKHNLNITGVCHLGANAGQERFIYDELINGKVLWVEAIPIVAHQLIDNLKPFPKQSALQSCLSDTDGEVVAFNISDNESQSSSMLKFGVHEIIHPNVTFIDTIRLVTDRFDTLISSLKMDISGLNLLSLDVQGSELKVLKGMGNYLQQFDYIISEINSVETYQGCALVGEIDEFLWDYERVETGELVGGAWSDALYCKKKLI